jgi:serine kinase of HPr protein (carbohydrate metabolism regulator)
MTGILHQATCVAIGGRAILIEGEPGTGKSSLALALIDRGAALVGDDGVQLQAADGLLFAAPPPHTAGLIEVRNVGLVPLPCTTAPVALLVRLETAAPRFVEQAEYTERLEIPLPTIRLWPDSPVLALRVEMALRMHGLHLSETGA